MIGAGRMDRLAVFRAAVEASDGGGGLETTWPDQFARWAMLAVEAPRPASSESERGGVEMSTVRAALTLRDDSAVRTIEPSWRVLIDGSEWAIRQILPAERGLRRLAIELGPHR